MPVDSRRYPRQVRQAVSPGTKKNEPALKEEYTRTAYLNQLASEVNSIFPSNTDHLSPQWALPSPASNLPCRENLRVAAGGVSVKKTSPLLLPTQRAAQLIHSGENFSRHLFRPITKGQPGTNIASTEIKILLETHRKKGKYRIVNGKKLINVQTPDPTSVRFSKVMFTVPHPFSASNYLKIFAG